MADETVCLLNLDGLSKEDAEAVNKKAKALLKKAKESSLAKDNIDAINQELLNYERLLDAAKLVEKRNTYLNKIKRQEIYDAIMAHPNDPAQGIRGLIGGTIKEATGSRASLDAHVSATRAWYVNRLRNLLMKNDAFDNLASGAYDKEVHIIRMKMDKGDSLAGHSKEAVAIAEVITKFNKMVVSQINRHGGFVGEVDGYTVSRYHDPEKIKLNQSKWISYFKENVDFERSLPDVSYDEIDSVLQAQANEFGSGVHISEVQKGSALGTKGFASIAKRLSRSRTYHFKTPEAEYEYDKLFGRGSLFDNLFANAEHLGAKVGIMSKLGPNPELNIEAAVKEVSKKLKNSGENTSQKLSDLNTAYTEMMAKVMPQITGAANITGHHIGATITSVLQTTQRLAKLGGASVTAGLGDPLASAVNMAMIDGFGEGLTTYAKLLGNMPKAIGLATNKLHGIFNEKEMAEIMDVLGVSNDFLLTKFNSSLSENVSAVTRAEDFARKMDNHFFKWNMMSYLDSLNRMSSAIMVSRSIGGRSGKTFDELGHGVRRLFDTHGITSNDWDLARLATMDYKGSKIISIEDVNNLDDEIINRSLIKQGIKPSKFQRQYLKDNVIAKFRAMFQDQNGYMVLTPDAVTKGQMYGTTDRGSGVGAALRLFMQFKQFPILYMKRVLGRQMYSADPLLTKIRNLSAITLASTAVGYMTMTANDIRNGRTPKELNLKTGLQSFAQGGGLGIYNDFMLSIMGNRHGDDFAQTLLGPTFSTAISAGKAVGLALNGDFEKAGDQAVRTISGVTPFQNLFYTKPFTDYLIMNQVKEMVSPGALARSERRLDRDFGQDYFMLKPSETMLFE